MQHALLYLKTNKQTVMTSISSDLRNNLIAFPYILIEKKIPLTDMGPGKHSKRQHLLYFLVPFSPQIFTLISNLVHCHFQMIV